MKRIILLLTILAVIVPEIQAQNNVIKLGVPALTYGRLNLNVERVINDKMTVNLQAGVQIPRGFPNISGTNDNSDENYGIQSGKYSAFGFTPQLRFYPKNEDGAPHGFYFGPYLSYNKNKVAFDFIYDNNSQDGIDGNLDFTTSGAGLGFLLGVQWLINDKISIDWNYFGIGLAARTIKMNYSSDDPDVDYEEIKRDIDDEFKDTFFEDRITTTATANDVSGKLKGIAPMIRMSLTIGYAF